MPEALHRVTTQVNVRIVTIRVPGPEQGLATTATQSASLAMPETRRRVTTQASVRIVTIRVHGLGQHLHTTV